MNELALFAGAGGGILGGKLLGWRTVCAVEWEAYPASVLCARQNDGFLPPFPIWDDVQTFDGKPWAGIVDVVSGGFPCQDISAAGKGAGIDGERSGMWGEMARIICEVRPKYVFVENSPMLTSRGLGRVLGDLASMGFDAKWGVLGAADVGANHQRDRIWIVAKWRGQLSYAQHDRIRRWEQQQESIEEASGLGVVAHWPTPRTKGMCGGTGSWDLLNKNTTVEEARLMGAGNGGKLNPDWVEWLMNWPIKWSDINGFDSKEFERWQKESATPLQESLQMRTVWWDSDPSQTPLGQQPDEQQRQQYSDSLSEMSWGDTRKREVERPYEKQNMPVLRQNIHIQAPEGENLQQRVREQVGVDEAQIIPRTAENIIARVDRLKAIGNGQVPLCAATAWRILNE